MARARLRRCTISRLIRRNGILFTVEENGDRFGVQWLRCRTREDLARRMRAMKAIADATYGLIGRSPDHVAGLITGLAMRPELLNGLKPGFGDNLMRFYERARRDDLYLSFAVTPPSGIRDREIYTGVVRDDPTLQVVGEDDAGVIVSGMKMLATGAVFGDEVYIGNLTAIDDKRQSESITAAIPNNAPGVSFWAREPYERHAREEADYPLSYRFDENDAVLVCDRVRIPWERVFLHNNGAMSRRIYIETPANVYQNQQSNIRFWAKMGLIVGLASRMCQANGVDKVPAVRETLGRLAALEATVAGLVHGQIEACENWPEGFATPNPAHGLRHAQLVPGAPHRDHRHAAHARGRSAVADAGQHRPRCRPGTQGSLRALVGTATIGARALQALQAGVGPDRLGIRRPPYAVREILRRQFDHCAQPERSRSAIGDSTASSTGCSTAWRSREIKRIRNDKADRIDAGVRRLRDRARAQGRHDKAQRHRPHGADQYGFHNPSLAIPATSTNSTPPRCPAPAIWRRVTSACIPRHAGVPASPLSPRLHVHQYEQGIGRPADLIGKRIGVTSYIVTATLMDARHIEDDYGVPHRSIKWCDEIDEDIAFTPPKDLKLDAAAARQVVETMLVEGEIDAVFEPNLTRCSSTGIRASRGCSRTTRKRRSAITAAPAFSRSCT